MNMKKNVSLNLDDLRSIKIALEDELSYWRDSSNPRDQKAYKRYAHAYRIIEDAYYDLLEEMYG